MLEPEAHEECLEFIRTALATIDPSVRPKFIDLTRVVVQAYIGRMYLAPKKKGH